MFNTLRLSIVLPHVSRANSERRNNRNTGGRRARRKEYARVERRSGRKKRLRGGEQKEKREKENDGENEGKVLSVRRATKAITKLQKLTIKPMARPAYRRYHKAGWTIGAYFWRLRPITWRTARGERRSVERYTRFPPLARAATRARVDSAPPPPLPPPPARR